MVGGDSGRATPFLRRHRPSAIPNHQPRRNATYHSREAVQTTEASSLTPYKVQLNMIIKALDNAEVCGHINGMPFAVIDLAKARFGLLTSDRPVEIHALREPHGVISMPISPTKLF